MRRVVSQRVAGREDDLVLVHAELDRLAVAARSGASSPSARAGTIASSSGTVPSSARLLDREPVRVGRGHHELARLEAHRTPVSTGRDSSRDAERLTRATVLEQRLAVDLVTLARPRPRAAAGSPRRCRCAAGSSPCRSGSRPPPSSGLCSIVTSRVRQQAREVEQQPARARRPTPRLAPARRATCAARAPCRSRRARACRPRPRSRIPARICTVVRVETPRETIASARDELVPRAGDA